MARSIILATLVTTMPAAPSARCGFRLADAFVGPVTPRSPEHPSAPSLGVEVGRYPTVGPVEEPGTTYSCSNAGYNALAAVLEIVSGKPVPTENAVLALP